MNTTARSIFVLTAAAGFIAFAVASVATASPATPLAVGLLAIAGLVALMVKSYTPRRALRRPSVVAPVPVHAHRMPTLVRVPAMVEYPARRVTARAA